MQISRWTFGPQYCGFHDCCVRKDASSQVRMSRNVGGLIAILHDAVAHVRQIYPNKKALYSWGGSPGLASPDFRSLGTYFIIGTNLRIT